MKSQKQIAAILLAAAAGLLVSAPVQAATYKVKTETRYYKAAEDKWEQESKRTYTYDKKGRMTSEKEAFRSWVRYDEAKQKDIYKTTTTEWKYSFDSRGRQTKYVSLENGKETHRSEISYGSRAITTKYWEKGKYSGKYITSLNRSGRRTGTKEYNSKNKLTATTTPTFDKKGNLVKEVTKNTKGKVTRTITWKNTYKNGKLAKCVCTGPDYKFTSTYYSNGNEKSWSSKWKDGSASEQRYDSKGVMTYEAYTDKDYSSITTYKNGWPVKSEHTSTYKDENGKKHTDKGTTVYKYKKSSGRVTEKQEYDKDRNYIGKTVYTYVKI